MLIIRLIRTRCCHKERLEPREKRGKLTLGRLGRCEGTVGARRGLFGELETPLEAKQAVVNGKEVSVGQGGRVQHRPLVEGQARRAIHVHQVGLREERPPCEPPLDRARNTSPTGAFTAFERAAPSPATNFGGVGCRRLPFCCGPLSDLTVHEQFDGRESIRRDDGDTHAFYRDIEYPTPGSRHPTA